MVLFFLRGAAQGKDTLFLKDGQLLVGKLKGIALGKADFDADNIEVVSIKVDRISTIRATTHLFKLETLEQHIYYTTLQSAGAGRVKILVNDTLGELAIEDISELAPLRGKTGALWQGNASAGYSYTRSSDIGRFNADLAVKYASRKFGVLLKSSVITTKSDSSFDFENASANLYASYLISPRWEGILLFSYQHNQELGLQRRFQEGTAAGLTIISSTHVRAKAISGLVLSQEKSTAGTVTPTQVEVPAIFLFDFYKFRKPDMTISMSQALFAGITQFGRFRQDGQLNISWKIIGDLSISLQLYDNYDNQPAAENAAKLDYGVVFSLAYKFSQ